MARGRVVGVIACGILTASVWYDKAAALPNHPIITEVYTDPPGLTDGPVGRPPTNEHQSFIEIYIPPASNLDSALNADALRLTFYEVEGDTTSSGIELVNYRFDLPTFDLNPGNGMTSGAIGRPSSGVVVLGWVDYTGDPPTGLRGSPSTRIGLVNGEITGPPTDYTFITINGNQFTGTTNFPVVVAENLIDLPSEATSGVIQNGSGAYLLVNRDSAGYVELCDDKHAGDCAAGADPVLPDNNFGLSTTALLDGFAGNDDSRFVVDKQPCNLRSNIDLDTVLPCGGDATLLVAQVPEKIKGQPAPGIANGYARVYVDVPKTTETGATDDPALDAVQAYRHVRNDGPFFPSPGFAALSSSPPELGVAVGIEQSFDVLTKTTGRPGLLCANVGGNTNINISASGGTSSNSSVATFTSSTGVTGIAGQTYGFPAITITLGGSASPGASATASITVTASNTAGGPSVVSPVQTTTVTATVVNPTQGLDATGLPFQTTVLAAVQAVPASGALNELLGTDLGDFLVANLGGIAQDTLGHGTVLLDPSTNLNDGQFIHVAPDLIKKFPVLESDYIDPQPVGAPLDLANTALQSAEQAVFGTYDASFNAANTAMRAIRLNVPDTQTFGGTFSPSEIVNFVDATGFVAGPRTALSNANTTRTFELVIVDTNVRFDSSIETGATDDFGIVVEVLDTEAGASVVPGELVFLSFTGGLQGADIDTLDVPPSNNVVNLIYLDLDNLHSVLGVRSIESIIVIDTDDTNGELDVIEAFSLIPRSLPCQTDANCSAPLPRCCPATSECGECLVDNDCPVGQVCDPAGCSCVECFNASHCDDGDPCTDDSCNAGICQNDTILCLPGDRCCPNTGQCSVCCSDAECDDLVFCNGVETCDPANGCQAGIPEDCDDGIPCTADSCDTVADMCVNTPDDLLCDNGLFCDGPEKCVPPQGCQAGPPPCPGQGCNEDTQQCSTCQFDIDCDDGAFCNGAETCVAGSCESGVPVDCDDGVGCTADACDDFSGSCTHTPNDAACDNGIFCDGSEVCDPQTDCQSGNLPCPPGLCDEGAGQCAGCQNNMDCDDGNECTVDLCSNSQCSNPPLVDDTPCAGGQGTCQSGECVTAGCMTNTDCDDGLLCTFDICVDNACVNTAARYADVAGPGGVCGPDGDVSLLDILAVLNGFQAVFASPCDRSSIDIAGDQGVCPTNGVIDLADILAVLDAFQGEQTCCPAP